jgi:hypothetical protein
MYYVIETLDVINGIHISNAVVNSQLQSMIETLPDDALLLQFIMKQFSKARSCDNHDTNTIMCVQIDFLNITLVVQYD